MWSECGLEWDWKYFLLFFYIQIIQLQDFEYSALVTWITTNFILFSSILYFIGKNLDEESSKIPTYRFEMTRIMLNE